MNIDVVIGAAYGDEGKGRVTAALSSLASIVVRFNGGNQAGHTVIGHDGNRHIFSHFGSGTMVGAITMLSRFFVCNPIFFRDEYMQLSKYNPQLVVNKNCMVSTPYDVALNILANSTTQHGTVGVGFGETIERHTHGFTLTVQDLFDSDILREKLLIIKQKWVPLRLKQIGQINNDIANTILTGKATIKNYIKDCEFFMSCINGLIEDDRDFLSYMNHHIVFEGAQGLALDQTHGTFPHVTRSNTGLKNVVSMLPPNRRSVNVYYLTRSYTTRHGNGPLPFQEESPVYGVNDTTNVYNDNQGSIRFSYLNFDTLKHSIFTDVQKYATEDMVIRGVMTWCDAVRGKQCKCILDGKLIEIEFDDMLQIYKGMTGELKISYSDRGDLMN